MALFYPFRTLGALQAARSCSEPYFAPFRRSTVGFDRLFDMLENSPSGNVYPPFDLIKLGENEYRIELAVAGFKPEEIDITAQQNVLIVTGRKNEETGDKGSDSIYRGIANRSFERRFALADHIQVRGADLKDGLLAVELVREIPEAMKPTKISIGSGSEERQERSAIGGDWQPASQQTVTAEAENA
jgi:molecular chaperone IbpA